LEIGALRELATQEWTQEIIVGMENQIRPITVAVLYIYM
jgi:hypothetical protein